MTDVRLEDDLQAFIPMSPDSNTIKSPKMQYQSRVRQNDSEDEDGQPEKYFVFEEQD